MKFEIKLDGNGQWHDIGHVSELSFPDDDYAFDYPAFLPGDVAALRGQDQLMTVEDICDCGTVHVVWFAGNANDGWTLHRDSFDAAMLVNLSVDDDA